ncbi:hypothetical protein TNCV_2071141 [Trichonephila clavipes]|uniref:Uncharacterized protein n=1 Tax=Trichonephila clavipes TaxID=2585209 RepID=A0A8X6W3U1_TRICX|nr:hypothetical protein TNCV_2071141 [Trichonephila clavipes]
MRISPYKGNEHCHLNRSAVNERAKGFRLTSRNKAARGLMEMDLVVLNPCQVPRTTHELTPSSSNFHTTPLGGRLSLDRFKVHQPLCTAGLQRWH